MNEAARQAAAKSVDSMIDHYVASGQPMNAGAIADAALSAAAQAGAGQFKRGDRVRKKSGSQWQGLIVGEYKSSLTLEGYCVESEHHHGSVQIYPAQAIERLE